ncbi:MAG TPA: Stp1/IreP family PP2C-type Ser/Thr phosphatase [Gemmatimonadaceae bacterium]|nr:Stp1/IreP family PP2C-type Ser/Thr phosphatase [Gemmatimonadaceae bacterium]
MSDAPADPHGYVVVNVFGRTDVGRTREHNEDAFVVADLTTNNATLQPEVRRHTLGPKGTLFMVADGMGGAAAGEIASAMAVEVVLGELREKWIAGETHDAEGFVRAISRATRAANQQIHNFAGSHTEYRGMGTTATVAGLLDDMLYVAQVGDSRAYLVRDGVARQITKDQSLMQKLIEAGELTEEEAAQSERRNIILQALGPEPAIKLDLTHQQVRRGDVLVLCSDGLSGQVGKDEIARIINEEPDLVAACKALIDRANENGGPDNITVIAARFDGSRLNPPGMSDEVGHRVFPLPETGQTAAVSADVITAADEPPPRTTRPTTLDPGAAAIPEELAPLPVESLGAYPPPPESIDFSTAPTPVTGTPVVSPTRRQTGTIIAVVLLIALVATAVWFIVRTAEKVTPAVDSTKAPPRPTQPAASAPAPRG